MHFSGQIGSHVRTPPCMCERCLLQGTYSASGCFFSLIASEAHIAKVHKPLIGGLTWPTVWARCRIDNRCYIWLPTFSIRCFSGSVPISVVDCIEPLLGSCQPFGSTGLTCITCTPLVGTCDRVSLQTPIHFAPYRVVSLSVSDPWCDLMAYL